MSIHVGTATQRTTEVRDTDGDLADPTTLRVILRAPDGTQTDYTHPDATITHPSTGVFVFTSPALMTVGKWWIAFEAAGNDATVTDESSEDVCGLHVSLV